MTPALRAYYVARYWRRKLGVRLPVGRPRTRADTPDVLRRRERELRRYRTRHGV